jgi:hypothetical protein
VTASHANRAALGATSGNTLRSAHLHETKFDLVLGLDFRNVLGDALRDEWRFARRVDGSSRKTSQFVNGGETNTMSRSPSGDVR